MPSGEPRFTLHFCCKTFAQLFAWPLRKCPARSRVLHAGSVVSCDGLYGALSEKSSKTFCCPASPSAKRTASWKFLNE